jgi:Xaa-Pro aminopeptidase
VSNIDQEVPGRIAALQRALSEAFMDGALIVERTDLYYFSGTDQNAHLYVPSEGEPLLMVKKSLERARHDSPLSNVVPLNGFSRLPELIIGHCGGVPARLGLEMDVLPVSFFRNYERLFASSETADVSPLVRAIRMVKSAYEISCISRAAELADLLMKHIPSFIRESKTENDLAARVEFFYRTHGHTGIIPTRSFPHLSLYGQIMSGPRAAEASSSSGPLGGRGLGPYFSSSASMAEIGPNEPVLVDYGANYHGYISDQTRIFSMGRLNDRLLKAHDAAIMIQDSLAREARPGVLSGDLYDKALRLADEAGFREGFMGYPDPVPFVGHGVGLELDDWPVISREGRVPLAEGMVIALEPKFVFPGEGVVGIENTFVMTGEGLKKLNRFPDRVVFC